MKSICLLIYLIAVLSIGFAQTNISGIINTYTPVTSISSASCQTTVGIVDTSKFRIGTKVMIIQMKGATARLTTDSTFGNLLNYNNAGNYEFSYVVNRTASTVILSPGLGRTYTISDLVQLITVPVYTDARVNGVLTCSPWNGLTGGVLTMEVRNNLTVDSSINASGKGFRGGALNSNLLVCVNNNESGYFYSVSSTLAASKGESIAKAIVGYESGKGKFVNGGGGGQCKNGGGGGGANAGRGGLGGKGFNVLSNTSIPSGIGADTVSYNLSLNKIFLGGAGGSGHQDDPSPMGRPGANGGGIIFLLADSIKGNGKIHSDGDSAVVAGTDGAGGGGAGGSIIMNYSYLTNLIAINAKGGKGGDNNGTNALGIATSGYCVATGGGGGGGVIWTNNLFLNPYSIAPGLAGKVKEGSSPCYNTTFGAISGEIGVIKNDFILASILPSLDTVSFSLHACIGDSVLISGIYRTREGTYTDTIVRIGFCDSVNLYYLAFHNCDTIKTYVNVISSICEGDSILLGGLLRKVEGIYYDSVRYGLSIDTLLITTLTVVDCDTVPPCKLLVPDAFSPNDDGINDLFKIFSTCPIESFNLKIFDRWGALVFETNEIADYWNGTFKGNQLLIGVYAWKIEAKLYSVQRRILMKGNVTLLE